MSDGDATLLVITHMRSLRWVPVRTDGVIVADDKRRMAYGIVGHPVVGMTPRNKLARLLLRGDIAGWKQRRVLPASGRKRIVGIANEGLIAMVPDKQSVTDAEVHAAIAPHALATHDVGKDKPSDGARPRERLAATIAAGVAMSIPMGLLLLIGVTNYLMPYLDGRGGV